MRATDRDEQLKAACAAMEDGAATARSLASSVGAEERLGLARAVVFGVVSRYWKAAADENSRWPLREPSDLGLGACPPEAEELSERVGKAAAALDPVEAGYRNRGRLHGDDASAGPGPIRAGGVLHAAGVARTTTGHGDGSRNGLGHRARARPCMRRRSVPGTGGPPHGGGPGWFQPRVGACGGGNDA